MTSPDSHADPSGKYHIQIGEGQGIVIGDHAQVVQQYYHASAEPQVDLTAAEATYRQQVVDAYKWLNFSGFDTPDLALANVPLEEIFVRLTLTVERVIREPIPSEKPSWSERRESRQQERIITVQGPIELGQALGNHLLIVGEPGAGKSTLLRWLAVTFAQGRQKELSRVGPSADPNRLPVLVELGRLPDRYLGPESGEAPNWLRFLPEYLTTQMTFTGTLPQLLTRVLADGRCLLLFDGLDEVADRQARARLARSLAELARLSPGNRVIIGSRPAGVSESEGVLHTQFRRCQIERFTPQDVQRFFRFWYALDRDLTPQQQCDAADTLYTRVRDTPASLQLASTPLLSAILVLIWRKEGNLPERRVDLYEHCCRVLIERWEASHDVAFQGTLFSLDWEDHLRLLTPLAYAIHSQEQRTSATKKELVPLLAHALQTEGYSNEHAAASREAKQFLDALSLRSGLLQFLGDDRYGFPHLTFQEYLAARYIAAQPDPDYIDLVMAHLHEAWWQQVHLLTIAHLGSRDMGVKKASVLILTILRMYKPPSWILRFSGNWWLRLIGPGKFLPQMQLARRVAWIQAREFELVARGYMECMPDKTMIKIREVLSAHAALLVENVLSDEVRYREQKDLIIVACRLSQNWGNGVAMGTLLKALQSTYPIKRQRVAESLGEMGVVNEAVINALIEALPYVYVNVREVVAANLEKVGVGNEVAISTLLKALHDTNWFMRQLAAENLGKIGAGNDVVISALVKTLKDSRLIVQAAAASSLGEVGVGSDLVINALLEALQDANSKRWSSLWYCTVESLGKVGAGNEAVIAALLKTLQVSEPYLRKTVLESLGKVGAGNEAVIAVLREALQDSEPFVRIAAAENLAKVEDSNEAAISALLEALYNTNRRVQKVAAKSLGKVGVGNEAVIAALLAVLQDSDLDVRKAAVESLGKVGVGNEVMIAALLAALQDTNRRVREAAVESLGKVGGSNEAVINALLAALQDSDLDVRKAAAKSLGEVGVGNEAVIAALLKALKDFSSVRETALESLGKVGGSNEAVINALLEALQDSPGWFTDVRPAAIRGLGNVEIKDTIKLRQVLIALNRFLHDRHNYIRLSALASIRQLLDGRSIPGYQWVPLRKRRARHLRLRRFAFCLGIIAVLLVIGLATTWLLGAFDPNGFPARFLAVLVGIVAFIAVAAQVLVRTLHDSWDHT